jgi:hypothetical protein
MTHHTFLQLEEVEDLLILLILQRVVEVVVEDHPNLLILQRVVEEDSQSLQKVVEVEEDHQILLTPLRVVEVEEDPQSLLMVEVVVDDFQSLQRVDDVEVVDGGDVYYYNHHFYNVYCNI